jgi:hypothetical protein
MPADVSCRRPRLAGDLQRELREVVQEQNDGQ